MLDWFYIPLSLTLDLKKGRAAILPMIDDEELAVKILTKLYRKNIVGSHKVSVDTAKNWVASDEQGRAETLIRNMITDPAFPLESYGGSRDNVRLSNKAAAREFLESHDVNTTWWD